MIFETICATNVKNIGLSTPLKHRQKTTFPLVDFSPGSTINFLSMVEKRKGRRLCIDFGKKKLGIAISDPTGTIAQPLSVIERKNDDLDIEKIRQIIDMYDVKKIVVGLPLKLSGQVGQSALEVHHFSEKLGSALTEVDIDTWDERMSTVFAEREMIRDNVRRKRRKEVIDQLAATIILQSYLDDESRDS